MNIDTVVLDYAQSKGLEAIATGGGCDYVVKYIPSVNESSVFEPNLTLVSPYGEHSPRSLDDPASVTVFPDLDWVSFVAIAFKSTQEAIDAMADPDFLVWCLNELCAKIIKHENRADFQNAFLNIKNSDGSAQGNLEIRLRFASTKWGLSARDISHHPRVGDE